MPREDSSHQNDQPQQPVRRTGRRRGRPPRRVAALSHPGSDRIGQVDPDGRHQLGPVRSDASAHQRARQRRRRRTERHVLGHGRMLGRGRALEVGQGRRAPAIPRPLELPSSTQAGRRQPQGRRAEHRCPGSRWNLEAALLRQEGTRYGQGFRFRSGGLRRARFSALHAAGSRPVRCPARRGPQRARSDPRTADSDHRVPGARRARGPIEERLRGTYPHHGGDGEGDRGGRSRGSRGSHSERGRAAEECREGTSRAEVTAGSSPMARGATSSGRESRKREKDASKGR